MTGARTRREDHGGGCSQRYEGPRPWCGRHLRAHGESLRRKTLPRETPELNDRSPPPPQTTTSAVARQRARLRLKLQLSNTLTFLFTLGRRGAARHHPYSGHPTLAPWHIRVMRVALRGALHLRQGKL